MPAYAILLRIKAISLPHFLLPPFLLPPSLPAMKKALPPHTSDLRQQGTTRVEKKSIPPSKNLRVCSVSEVIPVQPPPN